ncbi:MAG TPA: hypothetical protein DCY13_00955 [Verrucomicrobiales bacterium]|nr:hypothetical protein [Verrucomicrobiales bacterium]
MIMGYRVPLIAVDAMTAWATTDLPALLGHVAQLTDAREVDKHLLPLAVVVAQHHSAEAVSFLMTELSPSQRPLWVERITHQWMDADLETAAGWFLTPQVAEAGSGVAVSLATRIVGANSPEEAWDWLASLPPGVARAEAWTAAFREWGLRDPGQTAALINHLAGTAPERVADLDAASRGLAESLLQHDAALASTWIGTIRDEHVFQMAQRTLREHLMAELPNED